MTHYWPRKVGLIAADGKCVQLVASCGHDVAECLCPGPKRRIEVARICPSCKAARINPFPADPIPRARFDLGTGTDVVAVRGIVGDPAD